MARGVISIAAIVMVITSSSIASAGEEGWAEASATFYGDMAGGETRQGACGYDDTLAQGYGLMTTALSHELFKSGQRCGACYEIKCYNDPQWCHNDTTITVTATNLCPPNWSLPSERGGWCNNPRKHFDLSMPAFLRIATYKAGIVPVLYRRVPCAKQGGIKFEIKPDSNPNWLAVLVFNVGGAGDVYSMRIKGTSTDWMPMKRNWGQVWQTDKPLLGQGLSFEVTTSDGSKVETDNVASPDWRIGQTFDGKKQF